MKLRYWLLLLLLVVIFGSNYTSARFALRYSTPIVFALLRSALGCVLTVPFAFFALQRQRASPQSQKGNPPPKLRSARMLGYIALFGLTTSVFFFGFWYAGEAFTSASVSSVLVNTSPLYTMVLAYLFLRERVSHLQLLGLAIGVIGAFLVASNGSLAGLYGDWRGFLLLSLSAASYAFSLIIYRKFLFRIELFTLNAVQLFFATIGLLVWVLASDAPALFSVQYNSVFLLAYFYTAIFGSVIANVIFMALVRLRGPVWFSMWLFLNPISGVVISATFVGESLLPIQIFGMALVAFSIYQINREFAKREQSHKLAPA